jgi:hypothetical protein
MLGQCDARKMNEVEWMQTDRVALLPMPADQFFRRKGATPVSPIARRSFHRFYCSGQGILTWQDLSLGVYTIDLSRHGMGIISPVQLFPKDRATIRLWNDRECELEVARCRRLDYESYECGCRFVVGRRINENVAGGQI